MRMYLVCGCYFTIKPINYTDRIQFYSKCSRFILLLSNDLGVWRVDKLSLKSSISLPTKANVDTSVISEKASILALRSLNSYLIQFRILMRCTGTVDCFVMILLAEGTGDVYQIERMWQTPRLRGPQRGKWMRVASNIGKYEVLDEMSILIYETNTLQILQRISSLCASPCFCLIIQTQFLVFFNQLIFNQLRSTVKKIVKKSR